MSIVVERHAIDNDFINQVSTVPVYNVGAEVQVTENQVSIPSTYKYIKAGADLIAYQPYVIADTFEGAILSAPVTSSVPKIVAIPQTDIPKDSYGFAAIGGICKAKTGIQAKGDTLEVINSGTTLIVDGSSGTPAETANTVAVSVEAAAAAATVKVNLLNKRVAIAAS